MVDDTVIANAFFEDVVHKDAKLRTYIMLEIKPVSDTMATITIPYARLERLEHKGFQKVADIKMSPVTIENVPYNWKESETDAAFNDASYKALNANADYAALRKNIAAQATALAAEIPAASLATQGSPVYVIDGQELVLDRWANFTPGSKDVHLHQTNNTNAPENAEFIEVRNAEGHKIGGMRVIDDKVNRLPADRSEPTAQYRVELFDAENNRIPLNDSRGVPVDATMVNENTNGVPYQGKYTASVNINADYLFNVNHFAAMSVTQGEAINLDTYKNGELVRMQDPDTGNTVGSFRGHVDKTSKQFVFDRVYDANGTELLPVKLDRSPDGKESIAPTHATISVPDNGALTVNMDTVLGNTIPATAGKALSTDDSRGMVSITEGQTLRLGRIAGGYLVGTRDPEEEILMRAGDGEVLGSFKGELRGKEFVITGLKKTNGDAIDLVKEGVDIRVPVSDNGLVVASTAEFLDTTNARHRVAITAAQGKPLDLHGKEDKLIKVTGKDGAALGWIVAALDKQSSHQYAMISHVYGPDGKEVPLSAKLAQKLNAGTTAFNVDMQDILQHAGYKAPGMQIAGAVAPARGAADPAVTSPAAAAAGTPAKTPDAPVTGALTGELTLAQAKEFFATKKSDASYDAAWKTFSDNVDGLYAAGKKLSLDKDSKPNLSEFAVAMPEKKELFDIAGKKLADGGRANYTVQSQSAGADKAQEQSPAGDFLGKNKFGLIAGLLGAVLGMSMGGGMIGALLLGMLLFTMVGSMADKGGSPRGFFDRYRKPATVAARAPDKSAAPGQSAAVTPPAAGTAVTPPAPGQSAAVTRPAAGTVVTPPATTVTPPAVTPGAATSVPATAAVAPKTPAALPGLALKDIESIPLASLQRGDTTLRIVDEKGKELRSITGHLTENNLQFVVTRISGLDHNGKPMAINNTSLINLRNEQLNLLESDTVKSALLSAPGIADAVKQARVAAPGRLTALLPEMSETEARGQLVSMKLDQSGLPARLFDSGGNPVGNKPDASGRLHYQLTDDNGRHVAQLKAVKSNDGLSLIAETVAAYAGDGRYGPQIAATAVMPIGNIIEPKKGPSTTLIEGRPSLHMLDADISRAKGTLDLSRNTTSTLSRSGGDKIITVDNPAEIDVSKLVPGQPVILDIKSSKEWPLPGLVRAQLRDGSTLAITEAAFVSPTSGEVAKLSAKADVPVLATVKDGKASLKGNQGVSNLMMEALEKSRATEPKAMQTASLGQNPNVGLPNLGQQRRPQQP